MEDNIVDPTPKVVDQSQSKWRLVGIMALIVTLLCWVTAAGLTYAVAFKGVLPYWLPAAAIAGFSGEISLVIGLSLLGFQQFSKRFARLKTVAPWLRAQLNR